MQQGKLWEKKPRKWRKPVHTAPYICMCAYKCTYTAEMEVEVEVDEEEEEEGQERVDVKCLNHVTHSGPQTERNIRRDQEK